jgi:thiol:disulfide interchange protein
LYAMGEGVNQLALLLACFLLLAVAGWTLGRWPAKPISSIAAAALIVAALAIPLSQVREASMNTGGSTNNPSPASSAFPQQPGSSILWQPYSEQALTSARAAGHPVFIDFTAAWCLSCQFNERRVLKSQEVEDALRNHNVTTMKADWTNSDPAITAKLASVGRAGVPTYVVYQAAAGSQADVLPELLSKDLVLKAIERDSK